MDDCTVKNSYFHEGFIKVDDYKIDVGGYTIDINNSIFKNNHGYNGVILNIQKIDLCLFYNANFNNVIFENNTANNYGGVVYSNWENTNLYVKFNDCTFINNNAFLGIKIYYITNYQCHF